MISSCPPRRSTSAPNCSSSSSAVTVSVRPQSMRLSRAQPGNGQPQVAVTIAERAYLGEFWEQQMVGEKDIDLDQKSGLLDRGDEVPK